MLPHPEDNQILSYATLEMLILLGWMGYIHIIFLLYYISYNYTLRIMKQRKNTELNKYLPQICIKHLRFSPFKQVASINMMAILYFRYGIEYRMID